MPGVGTLPGLKPFLSCSALGMPGVNLPDGGTVALTEIPGGMFPLSGTGFPERPGGMFAGSSLISLAVLEFEFELTFTFSVAFEPLHAAVARAILIIIPVLIISAI